MNELTKKFWEHEFPKNQICDINLRDFWTQSIPLVRLDWANIDTSLILQKCQELIADFKQVQTQKQPEWWQRPRSQGWSILAIKPVEAGYNFKDYLGYGKVWQDTDCDRQQYFPDLFSQMFALGLPMKYVVAYKLAPWGWLAPHKDPKTDKETMNYFYISVNTTAKIRIWPVGEISLQPGKMMLFNQNNFVHSVVNESDHDRIVLSGRLDASAIGQQTLDRILQSVKTQYAI